MKRALKIMGIVAIITVVGVYFLYFCGYIGINRSFIERDARKSQKIEVSWQVAEDISDSISVMVFYPQDLSDGTFSIYVNRPGLSFGYFFRGGGDVLGIGEYIAEFTIEGYNDRAFISLNKAQVKKMEIYNGIAIQTINIDSSKPFAFVLPKNTGNITFFDVNGNIVETVNHMS